MAHRKHSATDPLTLRRDASFLFFSRRSVQGLSAVPTGGFTSILPGQWY